MKQLTDKVAALTGAGSGIGRALALELAQQGCHLALADIDDSGLQETVDLLAGSNIKVTQCRLDVAKRDAVYAWAEAVQRDHGRVNIVINNAGVALSGTVDGLSVEDYEWIMAINFWGTIYGCKAFLPLLEASGEGHIVNISSVFGLTAQPLMSGYNASKYAVRGFTESLRQDLELTGAKVSATCVHPGGIKTNIAKRSRVDASVATATGGDPGDAVSEFEKLFFNTPESAAKVIINGLRKNRRRVLIGPDARMFDWLVRCFPTGYQWLFTRVVKSRSKAAAKASAAAR